MSKRGISEIIAVLLLVVFSVTSVLVVWHVLKPVVKKPSFTVLMDLGIEKAEIIERATESHVCVVVKRGADIFELSGIKFILYSDEESKEIIVRNQAELPKPLETKRICFDIALVGINRVIAIPLVNVNGRETYGVAGSAGAGSSGISGGNIEKIELSLEKLCDPDTCSITAEWSDSLGPGAGCSKAIGINPSSNMLLVVRDIGGFSCTKDNGQTWNSCYHGLTNGSIGPWYRGVDYFAFLSDGTAIALAGTRLIKSKDYQKWTADTSLWEYVNEQHRSESYASLLVDSRTEVDRILVGAGEKWTTSPYRRKGSVLFYDGGWHTIKPPSDEKENIVDIIADPENENIFYALGERSGFIKIDVSSMTYQVYNNFPDDISQNLDSESITPIAMASGYNASSGEFVIYVIIEDHQNFVPRKPGNELYNYTTRFFKSYDRGASWQEFTYNISNSFGGSDYEWCSISLAKDYNDIAVAPDNPNVVLIGSHQAYTLCGGSTIFYSHDGGETWHPSELVEEVPHTDGWSYIFFIEPSPEENTFYASGFSVIKSVDSGATWESITSELDHIETINGQEVKFWKNIEGMQVWVIYDVEVYGNTIYLGSADGNLFISYDGGNTWMVSDMDGYGLGDVLDVEINPSNPNEVYAVTSPTWHSNRGKIVYSDDYGKPGSWKLILDLETEFSDVVSLGYKISPWQIKLLQSEGDRVLYAFAENVGVLKIVGNPETNLWSYELKNNGIDISSMRTASKDSASRSEIFADIYKLRINPSNPNEMYLLVSINYQDFNALYKTEDSGETWVDITDNINESTGDNYLMLRSIAINESGTIYVGTNAYFVGWRNTADGALYRSTDNGETWEKIYNGAQVDSILAAENVVFFSSGLHDWRMPKIDEATGAPTYEIGLFVSSAYGNPDTWKNIGKEIADPRIIDMKIDPEFEYLYLATTSGLIRARLIYE